MKKEIIASTIRTEENLAQRSGLFVTTQRLRAGQVCSLQTLSNSLPVIIIRSKRTKSKILVISYLNGSQSTLADTALRMKLMKSKALAKSAELDKFKHSHPNHAFSTLKSR